MKFLIFDFFKFLFYFFYLCFYLFFFIYLILFFLFHFLFFIFHSCYQESQPKIFWTTSSSGKSMTNLSLILNKDFSFQIIQIHTKHQSLNLFLQKLLDSDMLLFRIMGVNTKYLVTKNPKIFECTGVRLASLKS